MEKMFEKNLRIERYGPYEYSDEVVTFKVTIEQIVKMSPTNDGVATIFEMEQWLENGEYDPESQKVIKVEIEEAK